MRLTTLVRIEDAQSLMETDATLRDYFAARALPWVCSDLPVCEGFYRRAADKSYEIADAMLEARKK